MPFAPDPASRSVASPRVMRWKLPLLLALAVIAIAIAVAGNAGLLDNFSLGIPWSKEKDDQRRPARVANAHGAAPARQPASRPTAGDIALELDYLDPNSPVSMRLMGWVKGATHVSPKQWASLPIDLSRVDRTSRGYAQFKAWVDAAVDGEPGAAVPAADAAMMFALTAEQKYCDLAVNGLGQQVDDDDRARPATAPTAADMTTGAASARSGPMLSDIAITLGACGRNINSQQRRELLAYAEHKIDLSAAQPERLSNAMLTDMPLDQPEARGGSTRPGVGDAAPRDRSSRPAATPANIPLDLSYVDRASPAYTRFKAWVDSEVGGSHGYAFEAVDADIMFQLTGEKKYCDLAVRMAEQQVADAETAIASGGRPAVAGDSYLEIGTMISDVALTLDTCHRYVSLRQQQRWSEYAEQAVWNVWNYAAAQWGGRAHPWSGWSIDNPGNNYHYSFLEATMFWGLAYGQHPNWLTFLSTQKMPPLQVYFSQLPGGGSREGTGYGAAFMRLFSLYRVWRNATGVDLANANPHLTDSIYYWAHATVPTLDRFAPIGDQSRNAVPELFDYHRRLIMEARNLTTSTRARDIASWWLANISVPRMSSGFNFRHDLLPAGTGGSPPTELVYHAAGTGLLFARTGWDRDAMWLSFIAGSYNESHAHQDQGSFTLFSGNWLAVTENIWSHSGIQQGTDVHNLVRFERSNTGASQCTSPTGDRIVHQCEPSTSSMTVTPNGPNGAFTATANLTPAYRGNPALASWTRRLDFAARKLTVRDQFQLGAGTTAFFQVNTPVQPVVSGRVATSGRLRINVLEPTNATLSVRNWNAFDAGEFNTGWRLDVAGGTTGYVVELTEI